MSTCLSWSLSASLKRGQRGQEIRDGVANLHLNSLPHLRPSEDLPFTCGGGESPGASLPPGRWPRLLPGARSKGQEGQEEQEEAGWMGRDSGGVNKAFCDTWRTRFYSQQYVRVASVVILRPRVPRHR